MLADSTVKVDLTGPYDPGVTDSTWALVGVHEESDWGYVGLQQSKSAAENLVSTQSLEVQLRADCVGRAEPVARFHHDDDRGFRGPVGCMLGSRAGRTPTLVGIIRMQMLKLRLE